MRVTARGVALTDVGRVRQQNEDAYLVHDGLGLFVVADGMGGHSAGDVASGEALDQVFAMVKRGQAAISSLQADPCEESYAQVRRVLESAIQAATYMVFGIAEQDPSHKGMGTTISALLVVDDVAFVGQVGDSRVYLVRGGEAVQITEDHTLVNLQLKRGAITPEQAKTAPYAHLITRAVGIKDYVEVDTFIVACKPGDRFVLCSDGVHGYLDDLAQVVRLSGPANPTASAKAFVDFALDAGGKDNATCVIVDIA